MICWPLSWHKRFNCRQACEGVAGRWWHENVIRRMLEEITLDRRRRVLHDYILLLSVVHCLPLVLFHQRYIHRSHTKTSTLDDMIFLQGCVCVWRIVWKVLVCVCLEVHCLSAHVCVGVCLCLYFLCVCIYSCVYVPVWVPVCVYRQYACVCWCCVFTNHNAAGHHYSPKKVCKASLTSIVDQEFLNNFGTKFQNTDNIRLKDKNKKNSITQTSRGVNQLSCDCSPFFISLCLFKYKRLNWTWQQCLSGCICFVNALFDQNRTLLPDLRSMQWWEREKDASENISTESIIPRSLINLNTFTTCQVTCPPLTYKLAKTWELQR